jgi:hypothetical protein
MSGGGSPSSSRGTPATLPSFITEPFRIKAVCRGWISVCRWRAAPMCDVMVPHCYSITVWQLSIVYVGVRVLLPSKTISTTSISPLTNSLTLSKTACTSNLKRLPGGS